MPAQLIIEKIDVYTKREFYQLPSDRPVNPTLSTAPLVHRLVWPLSCVNSGDDDIFGPLAEGGVLAHPPSTLQYLPPPLELHCSFTTCPSTSPLSPSIWLYCQNSKKEGCEFFYCEDSPLLGEQGGYRDCRGSHRTWPVLLW